MATKQQDYYDVLGVSKTANPDEIKKAYRRLARKYHPDLNPGDKAAEEQFKKIQEAHDILSEPKKRQMYDQYGFYSEAGARAAEAQGGSGVNFGGFDFTSQGSPRGGGGTPPGGDSGREFFNSENFRNVFSQLFRERGQKAEPEPGADLEYSLNIDFWQAIKGTQVRLTITRHEECGTCNGSGSTGRGETVCPECNGTGNVQQSAGMMRFNVPCPRCGGKGRLRNACPTCHGEGRVPRPEQVEVRIPPGAQTGSRLRIAGKGNAGVRGGPPGDLYITTRVSDHPFFNRDGDDILIILPVTVSEAGLGSKIEVPTIDGRALLRVPPGTPNGKKFRMREKGVFNSRKDRRGDQIVEIEVQVPETRDERTRELLRELADLHPEDVRAGVWQQV